MLTAFTNAILMAVCYVRRIAKKVVAYGVLVGPVLSCQRVNMPSTVPNSVPATATKSTDTYTPAPVSERVRTLLAQMTLEEKIGQMTQLANTTINHTGQQKDVTLDSAKLIPFIRQFHIGSFLNGKAVPPAQWAKYSADLQRIEEFFRPSFQAAIDSGLKSIMINSGQINGEPVYASRRILTDLLRNRMGFQGVAVTDWEDIIRLVRIQKVAANEKEATFMAIDADVDMAMTPCTTTFCTLVKDFKPSESCELVFEIEPQRHLTYPDGEGRRQLENGYFTLRISDQLKRFRCDALLPKLLRSRGGQRVLLKRCPIVSA